MSESPETTPTDDARDPDHRSRLLSIDQFLAMQRVAQDVANQQFRRAVMVTSNVIVSFVALLSTAFGLVTALAWNRAVSDWLPTVSFLTIRDPLLKEFAYAGLLTLFVIIAVGVLGLATSRLDGRNLLVPPPANKQ